MGNRTKLDGIFIPVITPFNKDESINYAGIKEIAAFLSKNGVSGIIPAGSTGEMIALDKEEQMAVNRAYIDAGHQYGLKVVASTGAYRTKDVIEMSQNAEANGADGIMAVTPWYMAPNYEQLYEHYKVIHRSLNIPVMLYHNPYYSTVLLTDEFMAKLYLEDCIDAVKERQGDIYRQQHLRQLTDDNFALFYGYDVCPVECLTCWTDGWICGTGNLFPRENSVVYNLSKEKKTDEAMKAQEKEVWPYLHLFTTPDSQGDILWLQILKEGLKLRGIDAGYCRRPVTDGLPEETMLRLKDTLKHYGYLS